MANTTIQLKRSSVAGKQPNTSTLSTGELALNLTDKKLYSSNGTGIFEPASNVSSLYVGNSTVYTTVNSTSFSGSANSALNANNANNSSYLGGIAAASYVQNTDSRTLSGNLNFTGVNTYFSAPVTHAANVIFSTGGISANSSYGTSGQVLTTNGSSVYWSTAIGGSGTISLRQQYTGDGTTTAFTVTGGYVANSISVYLNGVMLRNGTEVDVTSGSTFTITPAPASGSLIDVVGASVLNSNGVSTIVSQQFTANGTANSFTVTGGYIANNVQVYLNGVKQIPGTDVTITSGNTVNFAVTPANNFIVDVYGFQTAVSYTANTLIINGTLTTNAITANGSVGSNGQILTSNGSTVYWSNAVAGATGGGTDKIFWENDITITSNYTITTNKNAMTAGPVTVNSSVIVTVPSGSVWTIV
jgi:hypothetical protein